MMKPLLYLFILIFFFLNCFPNKKSEKKLTQEKIQAILQTQNKFLLDDWYAVSKGESDSCAWQIQFGKNQVISHVEILNFNPKTEIVNEHELEVYGQLSYEKLSLVAFSDFLESKEEPLEDRECFILNTKDWGIRLSTSKKAPTYLVKSKGNDSDASDSIAGIGIKKDIYKKKRQLDALHAEKRKKRYLDDVQSRSDLENTVRNKRDQILDSRKYIPWWDREQYPIENPNDPRSYSHEEDVEIVW